MQKKGQMMNKHIPGERENGYHSHNIGQTATRNDWTIGISKSQRTYAWLTAGGFFFHNFVIVFLLQFDELDCVLAERWATWRRLSTNTTVIMSTSLTLSKTAVCGTASKLT